MRGSLMVVSLFSIILAETARAEVPARLTGHTTVPGQDGEVDYDITAEKTGRSKFRVKVKLKRNKKGFPAKPFYICMMLQLTDNGKDAEREASPSLIPRREPRPGQERWDLESIDCKIRNPGPSGDSAKPVIDGKCWCCKKAKKPDVPERMAYHLGCKRVDLRPTGGGEIMPFDEEIEFKGLPRELELADIESFYWDTFEGGVEREDGVKPWCNVPDCKSGGGAVADPVVDPDNACPGVVGQDKAMGPSGSIPRLIGVVTKGLGGVNIWAGAFHSLNLIEDVLGICIITRGQRAVTAVDPKIIEHSARPIKEVEERCKELRCDGKTSFCWLGSAPLDNFWTMRWSGEYPARLQGTFVGPPNATVTVIVPGQVGHSYPTGPTGIVEINDSYTVTPDSVRPANDIQMMVVSPKPLSSGLDMRFDGKVVAEAGNPVWEAGAQMHLMSFTGPAEEKKEETKNRWMLNLMVGGDFGLYNEPHQAVIGLALGYAVTANRAGFVVFAPEVKLNDVLATIELPFGFQYDFALPVPGLYAYPRATLGYALSVASLAGLPSQTSHFGVATVAAGLKYSIKNRWNVGIEPIGLSTFFNASVASIVYRLVALVGLSF
jgi:hypothetical protein